MAVVNLSDSQIGGSDPAGGGVDMAQWQNWIKMMLAQQPQQQPMPQQPGYAGSTGVGGGDPRAVDAAINQMTGMAPGSVNPGYRPPLGNPAGTATAAPAAPRSVAPTPGAPNLGYYPPNPRFGTMQSQVPSGRGPLGNNPIYTTMNLFGGGQQPAAAPAAPAPAPAPAGASNAPWNYGPLQPGNIWQGSGGPHPAAAANPALAAQGGAVPGTYPGKGWDIDAQGNIIPSYS
jgi:hypothetical protein